MVRGCGVGWGSLHPIVPLYYRLLPHRQRAGGVGNLPGTLPSSVGLHPVHHQTSTLLVPHMLCTCRAAGVRVTSDRRDNYTPGWKYNFWELKVRCQHLGPPPPPTPPVPSQPTSPTGPTHPQTCVPTLEGVLVHVNQVLSMLSMGGCRLVVTSLYLPPPGTHGHTRRACRCASSWGQRTWRAAILTLPPTLPPPPTHIFTRSHPLTTPT